MQVFLPPPEIKILNGNSIYSSLPKQTVNLAPPDLHASACRKNGGMLHSLSKGKHTGQTKHDFQNILGSVRLSDLAKTSIRQMFERNNTVQEESCIFRACRVKVTMIKDCQ